MAEFPNPTTIDFTLAPEWVDEYDQRPTDRVRWRVHNRAGPDLLLTDDQAADRGEALAYARALGIEPADVVPL